MAVRPSKSKKETPNQRLMEAFLALSYVNRPPNPVKARQICTKRRDRAETKKWEPQSFFRQTDQATSDEVLRLPPRSGMQHAVRELSKHQNERR